MVYKCQQLYESKRDSENSFQIEYCGVKDVAGEKVNDVLEEEDLGNFKHIPIPLFGWIRKVMVNEDCVMLCNCFKFERCGYTCKHLVSVANLVYSSIGVTFLGFTHHDRASRYRSDCMHIGYQQTNLTPIQAMIHRLASKYLEGPVLQHKSQQVSKSMRKNRSNQLWMD